MLEVGSGTGRPSLNCLAPPQRRRMLRLQPTGRGPLRRQGLRGLLGLGINMAPTRMQVARQSLVSPPTASTSLPITRAADDSNAMPNRHRACPTRTPAFREERSGVYGIDHAWISWLQL